MKGGLNLFLIHEILIVSLEYADKVNPTSLESPSYDAATDKIPEL